MSLLSRLCSRPRVGTTSQASVALVTAVQSATSGYNQPGNCRSCQSCAVGHEWVQLARQVSLLSGLCSRPRVGTTSQASVALVKAVQSATSGYNQPGKCRSCQGCTVGYDWVQPARQVSLLSRLYCRPRVGTTSEASVALVRAVQSATNGYNQPGKCRSCQGCAVGHEWVQPARQVSLLSGLCSRPRLGKTSQASVALVRAVQSATIGYNQRGKCRSCHGCTVGHEWVQPARQVSLLSELCSRPRVGTTSEASVAHVKAVQSTTSEYNQLGKCRSCHGCAVDLE